MVGDTDSLYNVQWRYSIGYEVGPGPDVRFMLDLSAVLGAEGGAEADAG